MVNSFIDLVQESREVDEMGVPNLGKLTRSSLGKIGSFGENYRKLRTLLKDIKSTEITMRQSGGARKYYPQFTNPEILQLMQNMNAEDSNKFQNSIGNWYDINGSNSIHMETDSASSYHRSHFPDSGIPEAIRGIGLGKKLYRALLRKVGYISSNTAGSTSKDNVWASMVQHKVNPDGTTNEDDAYAIVGSGNWMVFDKGLNQAEIIRIATKFLDEQIGFRNTSPDQFDMDNELFAFMPEDILSSLDDAYLRSLVTDGRITEDKLNSITNSRAEAEARARERADIAAREERTRLAREESELRVRQVARLSKYGADPDADWDIGDFIVVKQYLYNDWEPLPIREVAEFYNGSYYAVSIKEMIKVHNNEISVRNANDNRTTRDKTEWLKVDLDQIPDLENVNFNAEELEYINQKLSPETITQRQEVADTERETRQSAETTQNVTRANNPDTYGFVPQNSSEIKDALQNRGTVPNIQLLKQLRSKRFADSNSYIVMGPPQIEAMRNIHAIPVFIPWIGSTRRPQAVSIDDIQNNRANLTNAVTGVNLETPYGGLGLAAYELQEVTTADKLRSRGGEHFYVAGHQNVYGVVAKSEYGTVNTNQQQFIYLRVYGYSGRSVSVRLDLLRKIGAPISI